MTREKTQKPWGYFEIIGQDQGFKIKKIIILPQKRLSLQRHKHRKEYWVITKGQAKAIKGEKEMNLKQGDSIIIKKEEIHRLENTGHSNLEVFEVELGEYLEEDDIERLEDDFNRV